MRRVRWGELLIAAGFVGLGGIPAVWFQKYSEPPQSDAAWWWPTWWMLIPLLMVVAGVALVMWPRREPPPPSPPVNPDPSPAGRTGLLNRPGGVASLNDPFFGAGLDTAVDNHGELEIEGGTFE